MDHANESRKTAGTPKNSEVRGCKHEMRDAGLADGDSAQQGASRGGMSQADMGRGYKPMGKVNADSDGMKFA